MAELERKRREALTLLETLGLADVAEVPVSRLSFGHRKLIDLARALISPPRILLMDEPTAGLSRLSRPHLAAAGAGSDDTVRVTVESQRGSRRNAGSGIVEFRFVGLNQNEVPAGHGACRICSRNARARRDPQQS